jgi:hypothetical protein
MCLWEAIPLSKDSRYKAQSGKVEVTAGGTVNINFALEDDFIDAGEVIVTANRGTSGIAEVPHGSTSWVRQPLPQDRQLPLMKCLLQCQGSM